MDDKTQAIRTKIAKLLALARNDGAAENEAETALRMAESLMRQHGIEAAELDAAGQAPAFDWREVHVPAGIPAVQDMPVWFNMIQFAIGQFCDCQTAYVRLPVHGACARFRGEFSDVEYAVWLCKYLRDDCRMQSARFNGTRSERESFRKGYAGRVCERMREAKASRREAVGNATAGRALIVLDRKLALRDEHFGDKNGDTRRASSRVDPNALAAGRAAGERAGLARPVGAAEAPKAIR